MTWHDRIATAAVVGFTPKDVALAHAWVTCACGEQDRRIPRRSMDGRPEDPLLDRLGTEFYDNVLDNRPKDAAKVLSQIERRAAEILQRMVGNDSAP